MKLKSATIFPGIYHIHYDIVHLASVRDSLVLDTHANQWCSVNVASKNSANGLPINIQRTESTSAVYDTLMLSC